MGIISYGIKQNFTIYIGEVLARSGRDGLAGSWSQLPNRQDWSCHWFQKVRRKISAMKSVFSNVPGFKLHTWVRIVSATHVPLEI